MLSKFFDKSAQKTSIFSSKANYARSLFFLVCCSFSQVFSQECDDLLNFGYECPGPLTRSAWGVAIKGGVEPTFWTDPQINYELNPLIPPFIFPLNSQGDSFDKHHNTPWMVGSELFYNLSEQIQIFTEATYLQASGRTHRAGTATGINLKESFHTYRALDGYLGARKYFAAWLWGLTPFIGAKLGVRYHFRNELNVSIPPLLIGKGSCFLQNWCFSTGLQLGFECPITPCLNLFISLEGIFTTPLRPKPVMQLALPDGGTAILIGETGSEISVPLSLGLRWIF